MELSSTFPFLWVDLATLCTLLPLSCLFYYESLTNTLHFRWEVSIHGLSLSNQDYRSEMFKDNFHICCFIVIYFVSVFIVLFRHRFCCYYYDVLSIDWLIFCILNYYINLFTTIMVLLFYHRLRNKTVPKIFLL